MEIEEVSEFKIEEKNPVGQNTRFITRNDITDSIENGIVCARYSKVFPYVVDKDVLELGCGTFLGPMLMSKYAKSITATDASKEIIEWNNEHYHKYTKKKNINFEVMNILDTDKYSKKFDVIVALESIEHIPPYVASLDIIIKRICSILKDNGTLIISTPPRRGGPERYPDGSHPIEYLPEEVVPSLERYGKVLSVEDFDGTIFYVFKKNDVSIKIGVLLPHFEARGGNRHYIELFNGLVKRGYDPKIIIVSKDPNESLKCEWLDNYSEVITYKEAKNEYWDILILSLPGIIEQFKELNSKIKIIYATSDPEAYITNQDEELKAYYDKYKGFRYVAISQYIKDILAKHKIDAEEVLLNGLNHNLFRQLDNVEKIYDVVSYFWPMEGTQRHKGTSYIIKACENIDKLKSYMIVKEYDQNRLVRILNSSKIFINASDSEGFANTPLEAMACGLAVITTTPGTEEYAVDGKNCLIVPTYNSKAIEDAVRKLLENDTLRNKLIQNGLETAKRFSWDKSRKEFIEYIEGLWEKYKND